MILKRRAYGEKIAAAMSKATDWLERIVKVLSIVLLVILVYIAFFQVIRRALT